MILEYIALIAMLGAVGWNIFKDQKIMAVVSGLIFIGYLYIIFGA